MLGQNRGEEEIGLSESLPFLGSHGINIVRDKSPVLLEDT